MIGLLRNRRLFSTLLIADSRHGKVHPGNLSALAAAQKLKNPIDVLVLDSGISEVNLKGDLVKEVFVSNHEAFKNPTSDVYAHAVNTFIKGQKKYTHVVSMASTWSKDYFPRVAAVNDAQPLSEVIEVLGPDTFKRPTYAGNAIATVKTPGPVHFISFRPTNFEPCSATKANTTSVDGGTLLAGLPQNVAKFVEEKLKKSERPELPQAKIVVAGGRALKSKENFKLLDDLADALGNTAIGATRAAVDAGYCPNDMQVGQTGKIVAPQIYFAIGISGAIQHIAGMKDSKVGYP
jgi:electron transfer flavoprotein alpha subunit